MILQASNHPGTFERHFLRRHYHASLFKLIEEKTWHQSEMRVAQQQDHDALLAFHKKFQRLIQQTINLKPNEDSEVILAIKARLDKLYTISASLPDDQTQSQTSIKKLLSIIIAAVRQGAGDDTQANQELDQEEKARESHFHLLQSPLVADLINPASPIAENELIPTLLSATKEDLSLTLQIFDENQLVLIIRDAEKLLQSLDQASNEAKENLAFIQGYIKFLQK